MISSSTQAILKQGGDVALKYINKTADSLSVYFTEDLKEEIGVKI